MDKVPLLQKPLYKKCVWGVLSVIALVLIASTCRELGSGTVSGISGSSADNAANTADNNADNAANAADNAADNTAGGMPSLIENRLSTAKA